ncbi:hypothetical protein [Rhodococcus maanshanensis]|uniref:DUF8020 domain-containing protein n=1 Tax=Rhodococcus maanshanensis TaxID=183556 RepID=A0A1H7LP63_9NOCA|nr:hypothetical protein [Rhodococcus maanshanensis]SEL00772.1 hypothetical protein SAMN05444583_105112 [Rhodococcus maanshanensis]
MKMTKLAAVSAMTIASMGIIAGTAHADPAPATATGVGWNVTRSGNQVILDTAAGSLATENNHLIVRDSSGAIVESVPLALAVDGISHPVTAKIDGRTATLTADTSPAAATSVALPAKDIDLPAAVAGVKDNITMTGAVGGFLGAATGLVGGCILGAVAGGVVSAPAAMLFGAGPLAGCIGGALLVGAGASLAGTAIGGLGAVAANAQPFITLLNAPPAAKK